MQTVVNGFIIEANKKGYFYHRTGSWIQYDSPLKAYVWTEDQLNQILESADNNPKDWELKPATLHPSSYYSPVAGQVTINSPGIAIKDFGSPSFFKGKIISDQGLKFTVSSSVLGVAMTL